MPQRRPREPSPRLTRERAAHLAGRVCPHSLFHHTADTLAPALIELIEGIAAEPDPTAREDLALSVSTAAYNNTEAFGFALDAYVERAKAGASN
jgi:hypothetical protein